MKGRADKTVSWFKEQLLGDLENYAKNMNKKLENMDIGWGEPSPKEGEISVTDAVLEDLKSRKELGTKKYGTELKTNNGRNALKDAYEEALDLACYLKQRLMEES